MRREKALATLRAAVLRWSDELGSRGLDEPTRSLVDDMLTVARSPRRGEELEIAVGALVVRTAAIDDTAVVGPLFDAYAALQRRR